MSSARSRTRWTLYRFSSRPIFTGIVWGTRALPLPILRGIAGAIGLAIYPFVGRLLRALDDNAALVQRDAAPRERRRTVRRLYFSYLRGVADFWHCSAHFKPRLMAPPEGDLEELKAGGHIILSAHMGNWELGGLHLKSLGVPFMIIAQREEDPYVEARRQEARARFGIPTLLIDDKDNIIFQVRQALREGQNIILLADRPFAKDYAEVTLFGERVAFLKTPFLMSQWLKKPLIPMFFMGEPHGIYRGYRLDAIPPHPDPAVGAQAYADRLEWVLRRFPWQWYNFFNYREHCRSILQ